MPPLKVEVIEYSAGESLGSFLYLECWFPIWRCKVYLDFKHWWTRDLAGDEVIKGDPASTKNRKRKMATLIQFAEENGVIIEVEYPNSFEVALTAIAVRMLPTP